MHYANHNHESSYTHTLYCFRSSMSCSRSARSSLSYLHTARSSMSYSRSARSSMSSRLSNYIPSLLNSGRSSVISEYQVITKSYNMIMLRHTRQVSEITVLFTVRFHEDCSAVFGLNGRKIWIHYYGDIDLMPFVRT